MTRFRYLSFLTDYGLGEVLTGDRFGNIQLTIAASDAAEIGLAPGARVSITAVPQTIRPIRP